LLYLRTDQNRSNAKSILSIKTGGNNTHDRTLD
jgi:hypothetical protein